MLRLEFSVDRRAVRMIGRSSLRLEVPVGRRPVRMIVTAVPLICGRVRGEKVTHHTKWRGHRTTKCAECAGVGARGRTGSGTVAGLGVHAREALRGHARVHRARSRGAARGGTQAWQGYLPGSATRHLKSPSRPSTKVSALLYTEFEFAYE